MSVKSVQAQINGQTYTLQSAGDGVYSLTITAPDNSSYSQADHYYPVTVTVEDEAGNKTTANPETATLGDDLKLYVEERVAPVVTITAPTEGQLMSQNRPTITFTVTDNDSGVDLETVELKVDRTVVSGVTHSSIANGYSFSYTPTTALDDGEHTITVNASDNDGNEATEVTRKFEVLATAPNLSVTAPVNDLWTNVASLTVTGTTDGETLTVRVNSGEAQTITVTEGAFSSSVTLEEGENTLTFVATSASGVTTTITRTVHLDTVAPTITNISITPNPVDTGNTYVLSVTVTDE